VRKEPAPAALEALVAMRPSWNEIDWTKVPAEKVAERDRAMVDLVRGKLPAFIYCPTASDIFKAFELMDANGLQATLVLGSDAWKLAPVLKARKGLGPVVLDDELEIWETDPETGARVRHVTPKVLHDAGITFAVEARQDPAASQGPLFSRRGEVHLWYQAARLVQLGIPRRVALEAITRVPARVLGLEHRLGSLEEGKDADIAVFSGEPLDARSWVELVFIEGEVVYEREKDADLELLLRAPERKF
jgi:imidazolonepropionase-like amidohydrolase